jgi:hypothetical protein
MDSPPNDATHLDPRSYIHRGRSPAHGAIIRSLFG